MENSRHFRSDRIGVCTGQGGTVVQEPGHTTSQRTGKRLVVQQLTECTQGERSFHGRAVRGQNARTAVARVLGEHPGQFRAPAADRGADKDTTPFSGLAISKRPVQESYVPISFEKHLNLPPKNRTEIPNRRSPTSIRIGPPLKRVQFPSAIHQTTTGRPFLRPGPGQRP
ncbi:hypothetical protein Nans01_48840 [Nocardiopsis ansamitocini]|uniref:Uncharacterized protein n=1 Tax=Nocardiopsis ansamitocini TaxID=1670832 RepID=A0A9W6PBJ9_9ACTN|nr:hypothetical protein Nans01_48840 [Nocardiopsis ansamitocini]